MCLTRNINHVAIHKPLIAAKNNNKLYLVVAYRIRSCIKRHVNNFCSDSDNPLSRGFEYFLKHLKRPRSTASNHLSRLTGRGWWVDSSQPARQSSGEENRYCRTLMVQKQFAAGSLLCSAIQLQQLVLLQLHYTDVNLCSVKINNLHFKVSG